MAASAPQGETNNSWIEQGGSEDTKAIELGMSGMNLVSALPNSRPPALSGSSISSVPGDEHHHRHHSFGSISFPNSDLQNNSALFGSGPPSPSSPHQRGLVIGSFPPQNATKPPAALNTSFLSQIGKSSTANNSTASCASLSLTPTFHGDDGSGIHGVGRQDMAGSPWADLRYNAGSPYHSGDADSFDRSEDPDDGLMGLTALRDRAYSSPGPFRTASNSPPVRIDVYNQGDLSPLPSDFSRGQHLPQELRRTRPTATYNSKSSNSRPPLSGRDSSFNSGSLDNRNHADITFDFPSAVGTSSGRSDMAERLQGSRSRSMAVNEQQLLYTDNRNVHGEHLRYENNVDHVHKFGSLPTLNNIQQQQRLTNHSIPPRHIRSYSHSGVLPHGTHHELSFDDGNRRLLEQSNGRIHHRLQSDGSDNPSYAVGGSESNQYTRVIQSTSSLTRSMSVGDNHSSHSTGGIVQRSVSMAQSMLGQGPDTQQPVQRRNSDLFHNGQVYANLQPNRQQIHPNLQRHEDFGGSDAPVIATPEEMRAFNITGIEQRRNAGRYQQHSSHNINTHVSHINRRHSDVAMHSQVATRSGGRHVVHNQEFRSVNQPSLDDDLIHPLAGEHIDDPGDDLGVQSAGTQGMVHVIHHPTNVAYAQTNSPHQAHMAQHYTPMDGIPPTAGSSLPVSRVVYNIKFKRTQRNFIIGPRVSRDLKIGCYVKVEADRGEDLGIVVAKVPADKFNSSSRSNFRGTGPPGDVAVSSAAGPAGISDLKRIMRLATHDEVSLLNVKREEEEELLKVCREKVRQRALPMHVVDAEYQFDRHKLTFFFEAEGRIDFRELVRDLFSMYKTRIWMQQLDKNSTGGGSSNTISSLPDYGNHTLSQIPVMADSINEPYGIPTDLDK
mmetsp:Transcript_30342/g.44871  ORF Transcript_30342/g.44871 Transcript_30342/m.44871 type:complete len:890 (-) Transcript_30342:297-2966(-)|eukprot:CAMPEP_0194245254 /NCGR_PEP_ID=MMETSP0158-20130606/12971_1 /TAXON_ID=33649 /ORGANISM="Thalassionema nitzschioides, Strain L26-B" /LENGTH=889 /DNA_ID=CAMNT_0038980933 /DNA_START=25 /DNA_END=2694 /DNA_ORIENTATION=+